MIERLHKSVIGLSKTFASSFKKQPDRLSKAAALDTLVFLKIVKMVFIKRITWNNAFVMLKGLFKVNLFGGLGSLF